MSTAAARRVPRARAVRSGFALVEVVVALAVILILAAVAVPQLAGFLDQKRVEQAAAQLALVRDALYKSGAGSVAYYQTVMANAGRLSQLSTPITTSDRDSCGSTYSTAERDRWDDQGPYVNFLIDPVQGMATPLGQADDLLIRVPSTGGGPPTTQHRLQITWTNTVSLADAQALDLHVDGAAGWNAGTVQWTPQTGTNGVVTLHYFVVINNQC